VVLEADRAREFAPVKNAEGENSPAASRRALARVWAEWLAHAGVEVPRDDAGDPLHPIEISPLVADSAEELALALRERSVDPRGPILLR
jgi:UDP-N-acetylglucosamine/UDP-N-acetylgalactosamine diphosphorylase